jgi:addiction module HigA family antidote
MLTPERRPTPPGVILKEHYLDPRGVSIAAFARAVGCSRKHMSRIVHGQARIEAPLASRMARVLNTTPDFWLNLQNALDLFGARQEMKDWEPETVYHAIA